MRTERVGNTDVRFRRQGDGDVAVVFVHGFLDDQYVWDGLIPELTTSGVECVTLDLAGCGDRTAAGGPFGYERFADEVGAVVDALGKPFVIVGQSMGSAVAELVAAERPERAVGLVLVTPIPLAGTRLPAEAIDPFRSLGGDPEAQRAVRQQLSVALPEAELDRLIVSGVRMRSEVVRDMADCWNTGHPAGERPSRFTGPVLIIRGEGDGFATEELVSELVAPRFGSVESVSVGGGGHWVHLERPVEVAGHLDRLLTGVLPSGDGAAASAVHPQGWTNAFAEKSAEAFRETFAADVVLEASVLTRPVEGRDQVTSVMGTASGIYESLAFTQEAVAGHRVYLEWRATAFGGVPIEGVTILTKDDNGQIARIAIHHRPLGAVHRFSAELGRRLRGVVPADLFHQG
ncbi:alpha/beta fold hydrolase [Streptomyces sp. NPDC008222]|uniref:alpha/beta fold hydrolase n=1 Tax=Streptomyces sp. NPDC008222 TaxID=3364820 RepID=UPI0036E6682E